MKILFVLENYYPNVGGVETLFKNLIDNLINDDFEIVVLTNKTHKNSPIIERSNNLKICRLPFFSRYLFTFLSWLPAILLSRKCDIIQTTSYNAGIPAYLAGLVMRKKVLITFHEVWGDLWFELPFISKLGAYTHFCFEKFLLKLNFTKFIAVSDYTKDSLVTAGIQPKKLVRIYNGIEYPTIHERIKSNKEKFRFLYFGRSGISKGLDILIDAISILKSIRGDFQIQLIIPENPKKMFDHISKLINNKEISEFISIKSDLKKAELKEEIMMSDAVLIPSYSEGFCFAAAETIGLGVPIISSNRGALQEVVSGKFISMEEFSSQSLAYAMNSALDNKWTITKVKRFELSDTIETYKSLYKQLINRNDR